MVLDKDPKKVVVVDVVGPSDNKTRKKEYEKQVPGPEGGENVKS